MTPLIAPYRQGELDGLCGVYAIVNALRLVLESHPAGFTRRDWEQLFHTLLATIDNGRGGVCHVVANGMSDDMTIINTENGKALKTVPVGRVPHTILAN